MDVFDLAAKISLDTSPFEKGLDSAKGKMSAFGDVFKANIASDVVSKGFSAIVTGTKAAVGGIKNLVSQSQAAYGDYQQMVGGVQKLYGNMGQSWEKYAETTGDSSAKAKAHYKELEAAQNLVMQNANKAYQTSGMSANQYMETATQFSASLIKSLGDDTKKAAEQTDVAMRAISDNFNTFGGNIEDVINAYKGFSKQNYTMLDNLKLGYGGTKTEMENLIKDANTYAKSIGQAGNLSIDSFSDIVQAIELIQEKQQIAGTTAREASTTLQGSMLQMQSAWENLKTSMSDPDADLGAKVDQLVETITGRAATAEDVAVGAATNIGDHINGYLDNLLPVISQAIDGIANLVGQAGPIIAEQVPGILEKLIPPVLTAMGSLASAVIENLPTIVQSIEDALTQSLSSLGDTSVLAEKVSSMIAGLSGAVAEILPSLINVGVEIITAIVQGLTDNADLLLNGAAQIVTALGNGIITNLPQIVNAAVEFLQKFVEYINENQDQIQGGLEALVNAIVQGIVTLAPSLTEAALAIVTTLGGALIDSIPTIVEQLPSFVSGVMGAITDAWNNGSAEEKASIAAVLAPIITGGIGDAINGVKDAKDFVGAGADILGKIFGKGKDSGVDSEMFDMLDDLDPKVSKLDTIKEALGGLKDTLSGFGGKALEGLKTLGSTLGSLGSTIGGGLLSGLQTLGTFMTATVIPAIGSAMTALLPVLPIIAAIAAAIVGVILVVKNWDKISKALLAGWEALKAGAKAVWGAITKVVTGAWDAIKGGVKKGADKVKSVVSNGWDAVKKGTSEKWKAIKGEVEKNGGGIKGVLKTAVKGYLAPWKAGFDALNKASGGKLGEAVKGVQKNLKNMQTKFKENNAKVKELAGKLVDKVKEGWKGIKEAGGNFVKGMWNGIKDKTGWIVEKIKGFGKKVLKEMKKFFKIKSPSQVMRDEVGVYLAEGVAKGIEKGEKSAVKAADALADKIVKTAKGKVISATKQSDAWADAVLKSVPKEKTSKSSSKSSDKDKDKDTSKKTTSSKSKSTKLTQDEYDDSVLNAAKKKAQELESTHKMTDKQEAQFWISISGRVKKGGSAYATAMSLAEKAAGKSDKTRYDNAEQRLQNYQNLHTTSAKFEAEYWKKIRGTFKKGSDEYKKANKNYYDAVSKIEDERLQKYQDFVNNYSALNDGQELTTKQLMDYWEEARKSFKKGSSQWLEAENNFISQRKSFNDGVKSAFETFQNSMDDAKKNLESSLKSIADSIEQEGQTLRNSLGNWYEKFDSGDPVSADALWDAYKSQKDAEAMGKEMLTQIRGVIGEDSPFFQTLKDMGYKEGMEYYKALLSMGPEKLKEFAQGQDELLQDNIDTAKVLDADSINKQRADAINEYQKAWTDADTTLAKSLNDLGTSISKTDGEYKTLFDTVTKGYTDTLSTISEGMSGNVSTQGTKSEDAESLINKILPSPKSILEKADTLKTTVATALDSLVPNEDDKDTSDKVEALNEFVDTTTQGIADNMTSKAEETTAKIREILNGITSMITSSLSSLASQSYTWGSDMAGNFVAGVRSRLAELQSVVQEMASIVQANIGFSEPKEGPLSDFHTYAPDMMDLFASGIKDNGYKIADAFDETLGMNQPTDYGSFTVQGDPNAITNSDKVNQILSTLQQYLPQLGNQQIMLDGRTLVGHTATRMNEELAYVNNRRAGAFA